VVKLFLRMKRDWLLFVVVGCWESLLFTMKMGPCWIIHKNLELNLV